jgi:hypothetical protein
VLSSNTHLHCRYTCQRPCTDGDGDSDAAYTTNKTSSTGRCIGSQSVVIMILYTNDESIRKRDTYASRLQPWWDWSDCYDDDDDDDDDGVCTS